MENTTKTKPITNVLKPMKALSKKTRSLLVHAITAVALIKPEWI